MEAKSFHSMPHVFFVVHQRCNRVLPRYVVYHLLVTLQMGDSLCSLGLRKEEEDDHECDHVKSCIKSECCRNVSMRQMLKDFGHSPPVGVMLNKSDGKVKPNKLDKELLTNIHDAAPISR